MRHHAARARGESHQDLKLDPRQIDRLAAQQYPPAVHVDDEISEREHPRCLEHGPPGTDERRKHWRRRLVPESFDY